MTHTPPENKTTDPENSLKYMNMWQEEARHTGREVFPVLIRQIGPKKFDKIPLTKKGLWDASTDVDKFDWSRANGYGIRMGNGLYLLDIDRPRASDPPYQWIKQHGIPTETRIHKTPSGGWHLFYTLPQGHWNLRTRANVVPGLDTRGHGGYAAFGAGYEMYDDSDPVELPEAVCELLAAGGADEIKLDHDYQPPDPDGCRRKLRNASASRAIQRRLMGATQGLTDQSRSALDHSVARLLAMAGCSYSEIVWILLTEFEHGAARWKPERVGRRAAHRCAAKAIEEQKRQVEIMTRAPQTDEAAAQKMMEYLQRKAGSTK